VHPAAEPEVCEQLDEIDAAYGSAVEEVLALAAAVCSRRATESSEYGSGPSPFGLSKRSSTSQKSSAERPPPPANSTSSGFSARSSDGAIDPAAQTIASETLDFPEPFGPTTTATPGSSESRPVQGTT